MICWRGMACSRVGRSHFRRRLTAFTIVELIAITAILLLILAVMTPVFLFSRAEKARSDCMDHMRELGNGLGLYVNDSDDTLPMARYDDSKRSRHTVFFASGSRAGSPIWADLVAHYVPSIGAFACPSDRVKSPDLGSGVGEPLSYALNGYWYIQPDVNRETLTGGSLGETANAATKILLAESASRTKLALIRPDEWRAADGSAIWERHRGESNWLYGDLHVNRHSMPSAWKTMDESAWTDPKIAEKQPYPQWFPWLKDSSQGW